MFKTTDLHEELSLTAAIWKRPWRPTNLDVYDDSWGCLYIYGHEYGPTRVIRAQSWESAYEIAIDESPTISEEELPEAFGFWISHHEGKHYLVSDHESLGTKTNIDHMTGARMLCGIYRTEIEARYAAMELASEHELDLVEGYQFQANTTGTGIVNVGFYEWLEKVDLWNARHDIEDQIVPIFSY